MDKGAAQPATRRGVVIDGASEPHPGLAKPDEVKWQRAFPGKGSHLSQMRRWLMSVLPACPALGDVLTVANELATNAICHTLTGQGGWFAVEVTWVPGLVRVAVADLGGTSVPAVRDDPDGVHGRGLVVVQAFSVRTGAVGDPNGRTVWAEIAWQGPQPEQSMLAALSSSARKEDELMTTTLSAAHVIADALTGLGFDVRSPAWEDAVNLKLTNPARSALCELTIGSSGHVTWDYSTYDGRHTRAAHIISIVLDLLSPGWEDATRLRLPIVPDLTLQGMVGRALAEEGMRVARSEPDTAQDFFEILAEIIITNPAAPGRGTVNVADHGAICWQCQVSETAGCSGGLSTTDVAMAIAQALSRTQQPCCLA